VVAAGLGSCRNTWGESVGAHLLRQSSPMTWRVLAPISVEGTWRRFTGGLSALWGGGNSWEKKSQDGVNVWGRK